MLGFFGRLKTGGGGGRFRPPSITPEQFIDIN